MNLETTLTDIGRAQQRRLVVTNLNNILKKPSPRDATCCAPVANVIKLVTEVAGLPFGKDVIVEF